MPRTESKQQLGVRGEDLACAELERQGMQVLERNWRCRLREPVMPACTPVFGYHLQRAT
jgi:putative endonuclease